MNKNNISIMKKLFFYLSVAMLAVAAVSCQKEMVVADGEDGNVTLTIQTPEVATKAIADGENVDVVYYEVYKKEAIDGGDPLIDRMIEDFDGTATLKLNLLQNQNYVILFWAEVAGKNFYDTDDLRKVTVDYTGLTANNEDRAAFCQVFELSTSQVTSATVTLVRPFAQINLGTTLQSIDPVTNGYVLDLESSYMEVVGAATTFNVATMKTGSETTTAKFGDYTVPHDFDPQEVLTVNNVNYAYLGMNYILAANDKATVDVQYKIITNVGSLSRNIPAVPVQKNHRTNLLGNLLTQETAIEIVVDEKFIADINVPVVTTTEEIAAAEAGSTIWLADNTVIALPGQIAEGITFIGGENTVVTTPEIVKMDNFTFQNVKFQQVDDSHTYGACRYIGYGTFEECEFVGECGIYQGNGRAYQTGDIYLKKCKVVADWAYAVNTGGTGNFYIEDCEIYGWNSFGHKGDVIIDGTKFYSNGKYGKLRFYQNAQVVDCEFGEAMTIDFYNPYQGTIEGKTLEFTDCKMEDGSSIIGIIDMNCFAEANPTLIVDGVEYVGVSNPIVLNSNTVAVANVTLNETLNVQGEGTVILENVKILPATGDGIVLSDKAVLSGSNVEVEATAGSGIVGSVINIKNLKNLTVKGNGNRAYGIGSDESTVNIENSTIDYACGGHTGVVADIVADKYLKSTPEGAPAIGGTKISIKNSVITKAEGGSKAAAIGAIFWNSTEIEIIGSTISDAIGGNSAAGIGGSRYRSDISVDNKQISKVKIQKSTVKAIGGCYGAGIGAGYDTHCTANDANAVNHIEIINSTVNAQGGIYAAGIGTGYHSAALTGSIDAASTIIAVSGEAFYKDTYTTAQNVGYGVVDPTREFKDAVITFTVGGNVIATPYVGPKQ